MHEWIKLHTALRDSEVYRDTNAKAVFLHLLITANAQGKGKFSRFATSSELGMNPNTFKSAISRCVNKYQLCTISNTNKFTEFSILNWGKYQTLDTTSDTNKTPTRHQRDTNQTPLYKEEIKNKKKNNLDKSKLATPQAEIKSEKVEPEKKQKNDLVDHVIEEFKKTYRFPPTDGSQKKVRQVAWNFVQRMQSTIREKLGGEVTDERVKTGISRFFTWLGRNESFEKIQKLETAKLKMSIWSSNLKGTNATNERKDDQRASAEVGEQISSVEDGRILRGDRLLPQRQDPILRESVREVAKTRTTGTFTAVGGILQTGQDGQKPNPTELLRSSVVDDERNSQPLSITQERVTSSTGSTNQSDDGKL